MESPTRSRRTPRESRVPRVSGDERERSILDTAERLLDEKSFAEITIDDLARGAGLSRPTFYFYFASKQALLASVINRAVEQFNAEIAAVLAPERQQRPGDAVRATIEAAARLWWDHGAVQVAAFELGAALDEVYERTMENFAIVRDPTVALLLRVGTVPEAEDPAEAERLVMALILMSERNFYDLMRGDPTPADRDALVDRLTRIWTRAFGVEA